VVLLLMQPFAVGGVSLSFVGILEDAK
jgi:hypothetical protein